MARATPRNTARPHSPHPRHAPHPHEQKKSMVTFTVAVCMLLIVAGWIALLQRTIDKGTATAQEAVERTSPARAQLIQTLTQLQQDLRALPSPSEIIRRITAPQPAFLTTLAQRIAATASTTPATTPTPTSTPPLTSTSTTTNNVSP